MCGALVSSKSRLNQNFFLQGRIVGYTFSGAMYGYFGERLRNYLEYQALGALAYMFFVILTLGLIGFWFFSKNQKFKINKMCHTLNLNKSRPSFVQGLLMTFIPCPLLFQFFTLSILTGSLIGGFLVGLAHGVASTPALWWGSHILNKFAKYRYANTLIQSSIAILLIFNLFYFTNRFFELSNGDSMATQLLFCF